MKMNDRDIPDTKFKLYLRQLLTISGQLIGLCVTGMSFGYSAILLPQLERISTNNVESSFESANTDHFGVLSIDQESWIAASTLLPIAPGCCTGGFMAEKLGRKTSVMLVFPVYLIGWLIIGFANSVEVLIAGSFLCGYCVGVLAPIYSIYVSETSDPLLRGILLGAGNLTLSVGILACHAMGTWLHWRTTAYICGVLPVICWIVSVYSQESPLWLLRKGKFEEAKRSWIYLRGEESLEEFSPLETIRLAEISGKRIKKRSLLQSQKRMWTSRYFLKPLSIICLYFFIMQFSGSNVMTFYCVGMLVSVSHSPYTVMLIIDTIRLIFAILMCVLLKTCRRRTVTFISCYGTVIILLSLSVCLTFDIGKPWSFVILLVAYIILVSLGLTTLPWMLCGELFPRKYCEFGSGLATSFNYICMFIVIKTMPLMMEFMQFEGTFAVYGIVTLIGSSVLYFILPETKNKTLQEIQIYLNKKCYTPEAQNVDVPFDECVSSEKNDELDKKTLVDE
ncbi:Facilitated trehalose transporter Tret1 [Trachymyrmex septentrionalis]|uniref:Facilitated trehalose transporter Tret1 n=1 Tax=Trachymyrmex septentrionalis TaxID=34720 RepID=A0A195EYU0_9HYME|nr:PREDICTED: facilitated trehalose transporter Tret1-2 homolog [Trachymyrmex septentrionalis]KYN33049.1 Facilitated trehalose transporter Tret1 [Trachymyrmex septentrionalis]